jgi:ribosomal protein S18 acetylase RimI-like enzyme
MSVTVRNATPPEYGTAGRVTADAYREFLAPDSDWTDYLARIADVAERASRTSILVAVDEHDRIIGSATLELSARVEPDDDPPLAPEEAHIRMVGVAPDQRRRGIARALMVECIARARAEDKRYVTLHTAAPMDAAQRMYESLGFVRGPDRTLADGFVLMGYRLDLA